MVPMNMVGNLALLDLASPPPRVRHLLPEILQTHRLDTRPPARILITLLHSGPIDHLTDGPLRAVLTITPAELSLPVRLHPLALLESPLSSLVPSTILKRLPPVLLWLPAPHFPLLPLNHL